MTMQKVTAVYFSPTRGTAHYAEAVAAALAPSHDTVNLTVPFVRKETHRFGPDEPRRHRRAGVRRTAPRGAGALGRTRRVRHARGLSRELRQPRLRRRAARAERPVRGERIPGRGGVRMDRAAHVLRKDRRGAARRERPREDGAVCAGGAGASRRGRAGRGEPLRAGPPPVPGRAAHAVPPRSE